MIMAKKSRSSGRQYARHYSSKNYKKPRWIRITKAVAMAIIIVFLILAITGLILHLISHFK